MKQREIVFVIGAYKNGGVARHATVLSNEMAKNGHRVTILATREVGDDVFFDTHENVTLVNLKRYIEENESDPVLMREKKRLRGRIRLLKRLSYICLPAQRKKLGEEVRGIRRGSDVRMFLIKHRACVVIPFGIDYYETAYFASRGLGNTLIFAEKNAPQVENNGEQTLKESGAKLSRADGCVFQTEDERACYGTYIKKAPVFVIPNPLGTELPDRYSGVRRNVIVNFCRLSPQKNLHLMLDAFGLLLERHPNYTMEIYGNYVNEAEAAMKDEIASYIEERGLSGKAFILMPRRDIHRVVRDCAMFVSSSDYEGLSNSMIEAMAIGLPCVCTDCLGGGARELIQNGENGLLVPPGDAMALCDGMCRFIEEPGLAERCSFRAAHIKQTLSAQSVCGRWMKVIDEVS